MDCERKCKPLPDSPEMNGDAQAHEDAHGPGCPHSGGSHLNEGELIAGIRGGDTGMYARLVEQYGALVFTLCMNVVHDRYDAESVSQDVFVSAYFSLSGFRGDSFKAWLCRIAVNKAIDFKRRQSRIRMHEQTDDDALSLIPGGGDVAAEAESRERVRHVREMVERLPGKYSDVVRAYYFDEMSVPQIAAARGLPPKTVETQLYRARKIMRKRWEEIDVSG